jgi:uncharacterized protein
MKQLSVLIKPASSLCNMRCRYCFYADVSKMRSIPNYGLMTRDTAVAIIENIYEDLSDGDNITFAFQGGEPTLSGLHFFEFFVFQVKEKFQNVQVFYALQTNGLMLNDEWCVFLKSNNFLVGLSLDGDVTAHNSNRLDCNQQGTFSRVMQSKQLLESHNVDYNVLTVLTNGTARHPQKTWDFILKENIRYIQFIPCLDGLDAHKKSVWGLTPRKFYSFYTALFPLWKEQIQKNNFFSVKLFDDLMNLFVLGQATACGINGLCHPQFVIESDGSIFPCDFYVLDEYKIGNLKEITIRQAFNLSMIGSLHKHRPTLPQICGNCHYKFICGGGCKRLQSAMYVAPDGFCGLRSLLDDVLDELINIVRKLKRR